MVILLAASLDNVDLCASMWALPEVVGAAAYRRRIDVARNAVDRMAATTQPAGTDFGLSMETRGLRSVPASP